MATDCLRHKNGFRHIWAAALALLAAAAPGGLSAQDVLEDLYGRGVHSYFAGRYKEAADSFTTAISGGSQDPRAYYFRAMAHVRLGNDAQAQTDMQEGSKLEAADTNQMYPVSKSLERIQGSSRLRLEKYRATARAESLLKQQKRDQVRYEKTRRDEAEVLRKPASSEAAAKAAAPNADAGKPAADAAAADDPFADPGDEMPADDAGADEMPAEDPSADEMPAEDPAAGDDPFLTPDESAEPMDEAPIDDASVEDATNPPADDESAFADDATSPPVDDVASEEPAAEPAGPPPTQRPPEGKGLFGVLGKAFGAAADPGIGKAVSKAVERALPGGGPPGFGGPGLPGPGQGGAFPGLPADGEMSGEMIVPQGGNPFGDDADQSPAPRAVPKPVPVPRPVVRPPGADGMPD